MTKPKEHLSEESIAIRFPYVTRDRIARANDSASKAGIDIPFPEYEGVRAEYDKSDREEAKLVRDSGDERAETAKRTANEAAAAGDSPKVFKDVPEVHDDVKATQTKSVDEVVADLKKEKK